MNFDEKALKAQLDRMVADGDAETRIDEHGQTQWRLTKQGQKKAESILKERQQ